MKFEKKFQNVNMELAVGKLIFFLAVNMNRKVIL